MTISLRRSLRFNILFKYVNLALSIVGGILLVPFYLNHLSIRDYGAWLAVGSFVTWFAAMDPGIANLLIQKISLSLGENNKQALSGYLIAGLINSSLVAIIIVIAGYFFAPAFIQWLAIDNSQNLQLVSAFRIAIAGTASMIIAYALIGGIQGLHHSLAAGVLVTLGALSKIVIAVVLLNSGHGLMALPIADLSAAIVMLCSSGIVLLACLRRQVKCARPSWQLFREFFRLFIYSFGGRLGKIMTGNLDSVLIARFIGAEQVTAYSLTATAPRHAENLINQPIAAFRPTLAYLSGSNSNRDELSPYIERMLRWIIWLSGWMTMGLVALNEAFVHLWVGPGGFAGKWVAVALSALFWIRVWTNSTGAIGFSLGDIRRNSLAEWAYSIIMIPSLVIGVTHWGLLGIALAHIAVQLVTMAWFFPRSIWRRLNWEWSNVASTLQEGLFTGLVAAAGIIACPQVNTWSEFIVSGILLTAAYLAILSVVSSAFRHELARYRSNFVK
jgi:O-antigen/teichoic acid export membrane protein